MLLGCASSARIPRSLLPEALVEGSGTVTLVGQTDEQMPPSTTSTNLLSWEHLQQETATLDKDQHDRVTWLRGHNGK